MNSCIYKWIDSFITELVGSSVYWWTGNESIDLSLNQLIYDWTNRFFIFNKSTYVSTTESIYEWIHGFINELIDVTEVIGLPIS